MGRPKSDMTKLLQSNIRERVQEYIWKIYAYHRNRPNDIRSWLIHLNNCINRLYLFNITKNNLNAFNYEEDELKYIFTDTLFEQMRDIEALRDIWMKEGYPFIFLNENDLNKLRILCNKYVDCILANNKFIINQIDLK